MSKADVQIRLEQTEVLTASQRREFVKAIHKGDLNSARNLLRKDLVDAFVRTRKGERVNPLYVAIKTHRMDMCVFLIENGADLNVKYQFGQNPLHVAVADKHFDIAYELAAHGSNIHATDEFGQTAIGMVHDGEKEKKLYSAYSLYRNNSG